jgi:hypothetical protein
VATGVEASCKRIRETRAKIASPHPLARDGIVEHDRTGLVQGQRSRVKIAQGAPARLRPRVLGVAQDVCHEDVEDIQGVIQRD